MRTRNLRLHSLTDILDLDVRLILPVGGNMNAIFANASSNTLLGQLYAKNVLPHRDTTLVAKRTNDEAIRFLVEHENYAVVTLETSGFSSTEYPCGIIELDEGVRPVHQTFGYSKNWELTELFNHRLNQMVASGVARKTWSR